RLYRLLALKSDAPGLPALWCSGLHFPQAAAGRHPRTAPAAASEVADVKRPSLRDREAASGREVGVPLPPAPSLPTRLRLLLRYDSAQLDRTVLRDGRPRDRSNLRIPRD